MIYPKYIVNILPCFKARVKINNDRRRMQRQQSFFPLFCSAEYSDKPGSVVCDHLSWTAVACSLERSTRRRDGPPHGLLFDLASDGVYNARPVTSAAVVSYTALSALRFSLGSGSDRFSLLTRFPFCCTFPEVTLAGRYPASCPVKPGLSSAGK